MESRLWLRDRVGEEFSAGAFVGEFQEGLLLRDMRADYRKREFWLHVEKPVAALASWNSELEVPASSEGITGIRVITSGEFLLHIGDELLALRYFVVSNPDVVSGLLRNHGREGELSLSVRWHSEASGGMSRAPEAVVVGVGGTTAKEGPDGLAEVGARAGVLWTPNRGVGGGLFS